MDSNDQERSMKPIVATVGVIGLGIMGGAMAAALRDADFEVVGFDIAKSARNRLKRAGGQPLASSTAVAAAADVVITSLATVAALEDAIGKIVAARRPNRSVRLLVIEMSTLPIADKERARDRLTAAGIGILDCPISGTAVRMKVGGWSIFMSGDIKDVKRAAPIVGVFTAKAPYVGAFGNGTKMKFIANHLVAIYNVAYGETMTFARKLGLAPAQVLELIGGGILGTGVFKLRGAMMVERKYSPPTMKIEVWQKDMQVIGDMAKAVGCPTPLFTACAPIYTAAMAQGRALQDTASVCEVIGAMAGIGGRKSGKKRTLPPPALPLSRRFAARGGGSQQPSDYGLSRCRCFRPLFSLFSFGPD
jgi:L-threonate 2-dehydrogenase